MIDPQQVRAVIFDLDDTLRYNEPDGFRHFVAGVRQLGLEVSPEQERLGRRWVHQYWATSDELLEDVQGFDQRDDSFWRNYGLRQLNALGISAAEAEAHAPALFTLMREEYDPENRLATGAQQTLRSLRTSGYLVGVLTNRTRPVYEEMRLLQLDLELDFFLAASQLGAFKPHRQIFDQLLAFIGLPAEQVVYVGDNYYADILGAQGAGLLAVLIDPQGLYPEAECPVVSALPEMLELFELEPIS